MLLGCLVVLLAAAGASAVFALEEVHTLRDDLNLQAPLKLSTGTLASAGWGDAQTLLLVGNDQRKHTTTTPVLPHSNEMLLVRLDPSKPWISMMSIPRELMVTIQCPGGPATTRLNYAYTCGGSNGIGVLTKTIKQVTGLQVNHVVVIDFNNFERAVNDIGCVYSTVDRRYLHVNTASSQQYFEINLQPGYQKMCGTQALQFVSYRHDDTSLVRDSRDQDFLLDVKKQYGPTLVDNAHQFERVFGQTVQTDNSLHGTSAILNLLGTLISSVDKPVRQVQFQVTLEPTGWGPCSGCDTATQQQISASVNSFLNGGGGVSKQATAKIARAVHAKNGVKTLPLAPVASSELAQAHRIASKVPFTFEFPRVQDSGGTGLLSLRHYLIHDQDGTPYPAYVAVFSAGQLGQYYDVQGMTWTTAPMFDSPDQTVAVGGRTYYLFYSGQHLQVVAWYAHNAVYWVHNTLTDSIGNGEMVAIAEQTAPVVVSAVAAQQARLSLKAAVVPTRIVKAKSDLRKTIGSLGGLVTLLALPLLAFLAIRRMLETRKVRTQIAAGEVVTGRLPVAPNRLYAATAGRAAMRPAGASVPLLRSSARAPAIPGVTVYRRSRRPRPSTILLAVVVLAAGGVLGYVLTKEGGHVVGAVRKTARANQRGRGAARGAKIPDVPVAVLNSTQINGAAHQLAVQLQGDGVTVSEVGNVTETRPPGLEVLYGVGEKNQAERLARLLSGRSPTVAPIDPVTAAAAGSDSLAVIIT
jgi:polyisoprenyl-teichoic acid--peptidoglycan teichoic acid transferase